MSRFQGVLLTSLSDNATPKDIQTEVRKALLDLLRNDNTLYEELFPKSGSNPNGSYIKFPDGTMIQWGQTTITTSNSFAPFFFGSNTTVTFPIQFLMGTIPFVFTNADMRGSIGSSFVRTGTTESLTHLNIMTSDNATSYTVIWQAIGKWKQ